MILDFKPPEIDTEAVAEPVLGAEATAVGETGAMETRTGGWTPEVMQVLLQGLYGMMASMKGPHWAWNQEEGGPLVQPTAEVFNMTPGLKDLAPEHVAIVTVVLGHGAMITKRLAWDRQLAEAKKAALKAPESNAARKDPESIYGSNQLEG